MTWSSEATTGLKWVDVTIPDVRVTCPHCTSTRVVGIVLHRVYPKVLYWLCEECRRRWHAYSHEANPAVHRLADAVLEAYADDE